MAETTKPYQPGYCKKCGNSSGCMCPRDEEERNRPACGHPFLVKITHAIAEELGVDTDAIHTHLVLYACRHCGKVVAPFDPKQKIYYKDSGPVTFRAP